MKHRILSLLLALLMVVSTVAFTGCSSDEEKEGTTANTSTREIIALNMYIITEEETTKEAAAQVQMAINEILLPNYKTLLKINYLTEDEYWPTVENALEETDPSELVINTNAKVVGTEKMDFTQMIEYIFQDTTTDIELNQPQIDIFVVNDHEKYVELANDGKLKGLNEYINYDSKILSTKIYPTIMTAAKVGNETYGVPTNFGMEHGEYTYLVFNEDLVKEYGFEVKRLTNYSDNNFAKFLASVKADHPDVWPISEPLSVAGLEYYEGDPAFIAVAGQFNYMASGSTPSLLTKAYTDNIRKTAEYQSLGYFPAEGNADANARYAIKVEKSTELLDEPEQKRWVGEDGATYVRYLYDIPRLTVEDAFTSAMCVSATSPVPQRAMEIITLFNTNKELANMLQYGIEGVHYEIDERDNSFHYINNKDTGIPEYLMDNIITGNTYIKYSPDNDMEYFERSKASNLGAAPSGFLGVNFDFTGVEKSQFECARVILVKAQEAIDNGADITEVINITVRELENLGCTRASAVSDYGGIFGRIQAGQRQQGQVIAKTFAISDDILRYNEDYGVIIKREPKKVTDTAAEGEAAEGEVAEGEAAEGETAEAEADAATEEAAE